MEIGGRKVLLCSCEKTMELDAKALGHACGTEAPVLHHHLCRTQLDRYDTALKGDQPLLVACTQESPLFTEVAMEAGRTDKVSFVNIREQAGWCEQGQNPTAKIAALLKTATYKSAPARLKSIKSEGLCLVYGQGQEALTAAKLLSQHLSVTLLLEEGTDVLLPSVLELPVFQGRVAKVTGSFGAFEVTVDQYASMLPSSRKAPDFALAQNGAVTQCSLILDLSGRDPMLTGYQHRDGYRRADPRDKSALYQAIMDLQGLTGEFEKPIYVDYIQDICAHSRSRKTGCNKCLDICPAGAISDNEDFVSIDPVICGGCGSCHAICPTGAISYTYPKQNDLVGRTQLLLQSYLQAGGENPVLLIHDFSFGSDLVGAMARHGRGLPGNVLPFSVHSVTVFGHVELLAALTSGVRKILIVCDPTKQSELTGLEDEIILSDALMSGFGYGADSRIEVILEADPDLAELKIWSAEAVATELAEEFQSTGTKREIARNIFAKLHKASAISEDILALPKGAPYGHLEIDQMACTLCMACVSICPTDALRDTADKPQLKLIESACVQCGLCAQACPENALTPVPRLNLSTSVLQPVLLYEEEPFHCIECGKAFATRSTIERISLQLAGKHSMFQEKDMSRLIEMCADCRIVAQANSDHDPFAGNTRPRIRTTDDYLEAEKKGLSVDDFLIDD